MAGKAKPPKGSLVGNSFEADAARIYISELTDIDKNFGVTEGKSGEMKDRSGIGIKADGVRIIGREGVKIVTGRAGGTGEKNSLIRQRSNAEFIFNAAINIAMALPGPLQGAAISAAFAAYFASIGKTQYSMYQFFINKALWDINYLEPYGYRYIESRNVKTT